MGFTLLIAHFLEIIKSKKMWLSRLKIQQLWQQLEDINLLRLWIFLAKSTTIEFAN